MNTEDIKRGFALYKENSCFECRKKLFEGQIAYIISSVRMTNTGLLVNAIPNADNTRAKILYCDECWRAQAGEQMSMICYK